MHAGVFQWRQLSCLHLCARKREWSLLQKTRSRIQELWLGIGNMRGSDSEIWNLLVLGAWRNPTSFGFFFIPKFIIKVQITCCLRNYYSKSELYIVSALRDPAYLPSTLSALTIWVHIRTLFWDLSRKKGLGSRFTGQALLASGLGFHPEVLRFPHPSCRSLFLIPFTRDGDQEGGAPIPSCQTNQFIPKLEFWEVCTIRMIWIQNSRHFVTICANAINPNANQSDVFCFIYLCIISQEIREGRVKCRYVYFMIS